MIGSSKKNTDIMYSSIMLIALGVLLQSYFTYINIILVSITLFITGVNLCNKKITKANTLLFVACCICAVICFCYGQSVGYQMSAKKIIYFIYFWGLYYNLIYNNKSFIRYIETNLSVLKIIVILWSMIVGVTIFIPQCYATVNTWGEYKYFFSIVQEGGSRLGEDAVMIMAIILILSLWGSAKKYFVFVIVPTYTVIMCGSRLYLLFGVVEILIILYVLINNEKKFILLSISTVVSVFGLSYATALGAKITAKQYTSSSIHNKYDTISSGRFTPIIRGVKSFFNLQSLNKIFGNGYGFIEEVTFNWVFNDFIEITLIYGLLGLFCYLYIVRKTMTYMRKTSLPFYMKAMIFCTYFVAASFALFYRSIAYVTAFFITVAVLGGYVTGKNDEEI